MKNLLRLLCLLAFPAAVLAQETPNYVAPACNGFIDCWQARATATQNAQPHWVTPLVTVTPRLEQEFRSDFVRQIAEPAGTTTWNFGNGKGLELIPWKNIELIFNVPPYIQHNSTAKDGFGDVSFLLKYRILSGNEHHGNYIVTAFLGASLPTGSYKNGAADSAVTPTLAAGKGFGLFDVQSTIGATLPTHNGDTAGKPLAWNTTAQWHLGKWFWPEIEDNMTHYIAGDHDGMTQNFVTPGVMFGRFRLSKNHPRLGATFGAGFQTRTSEFSTTNHNIVFSGRIPF